MSDQLSQFRQNNFSETAAQPPVARTRQRTFRIEVLLGLVFLAAGIIFAIWIRQSGTSTTQVVGLVQPLPAGHVVSETDLVPVDVTKDVSAQFIPLSSQGQITGGVLASDAIAGPLARAAIRPAQSVLNEGEALIASAMEGGTFPPSLSAGDVVAIVTTPSLSEVDGVVEKLAQTATVYAVTPPSEFSTKTIITLRTDVAVAERVAASGPVHLSVLQFGAVQ